MTVCTQSRHSLGNSQREHWRAKLTGDMPGSSTEVENPCSASPLCKPFHIFIDAVDGLYYTHWANSMTALWLSRAKTFRRALLCRDLLFSCWSTVVTVDHPQALPMLTTASLTSFNFSLSVFITEGHLRLPPDVSNASESITIAYSFPSFFILIFKFMCMWCWYLYAPYDLYCW